MKKKITSILEIGLACIMGFFAFYGMFCFVKTIAERAADSSKTKEIPYNINYSKYNINKDMGQGLLIISGNGIVSKEIIDMFEDVEVIYICESISGVEPNAFRDAEKLRTLVMSLEIYSYDMDLPRLTDLFFIEDNDYKEYLSP